MKRTLIPILTIIILTAMLLGCTQQMGGKTSVTPEAGSGAENTTVQPEMVSDEKPVLRVLGQNVGFDPNKDIMNQEITKVTGYTVEYFTLPAENADEKLNIELSSGTSYDIVKMTQSQYYRLVGQGALLPLDELLDKYGPDIKAGVMESTWEAAKYNGQIYTFPMRKEYTKDVINSIAVREDILEEFNLSVPTTIDEFYDALKIIKQNKPGLIALTGPFGEGLASPGTSNWKLSPTICSAFGIYNEWQEIDGQLVPMIKHPRMKECLEFMHQLYEEELIDADWPINTTAIINEKFTSGKAVMTLEERGNSAKIIPSLLENFPDAKVGHILPLIGRNGERGQNVEDRILYYSTIPKSAKNPVHATIFLNEKMKPENFTRLVIGEEGVHYTVTGLSGPAGYEPIMPKFTDERSNANWYINTINEYKYPDMWTMRNKKSQYLWEIFEAVSLNCKDIGKPDPIGYMPPSSNVSKYIQTLNKLTNDYYLKIIAGAESLDKYEEFLAQWDASGGTVVTDDINSWYKEYYNK